TAKRDHCSSLGLRQSYPVTAYLGLLFDEGKYICIKDIGVGGEHTVGVARIGLQRALLQELDRLESRVGDRNDLVVLAMKHERWNTDRLQVFGLVGFGESLDAFVMGVGRTFHALAPPVAHRGFDLVGTHTVEAIERAAGHIEEELRAVGG